MTEILNECDLHQDEDDTFKRSVVRCILAKRLLAMQFPDAHITPSNSRTDFITELGVDIAWSQLVNECASIIESGNCSKYSVQKGGLNVLIEPKE